MKKQNFVWKLITILVIFLFVFYIARSLYSHQSEREIHEIENKKFPDPSILPLTRFELGRRGWTYLHTMASNFPLRDGETEEGKLALIAQFLTLWGQIYPCSLCGNHFLQMMKEKPPPTTSRAAFEVWLCEVFIHFNQMLLIYYFYLLFDHCV
jgi:hypothetical protein